MKIREIQDNVTLMLVFDRNEELEEKVREIIIRNEEMKFEMMIHYWKKVITVDAYDMASEIITSSGEIELFPELMEDLRYNNDGYIPELNMVELLARSTEYIMLCEDCENNIDEINDACGRFCDLFEEGCKEYFKRINSRYYICQEFTEMLQNLDYSYFDMANISNDDTILENDLRELINEEIDENYAISNEKTMLLHELMEMKAKVQELERRISSL